MQDSTYRVLRLLAGLAAAAIAVWLTLRFLLPWLAPFLLALLLSALLEPAVRALTRRGWRRGFAAGMLTLLLVSLLIWALTALGGRCVSRASALARELPALVSRLSRAGAALEQRLLGMMDSGSPELRDYLELALSGLGEALGTLPLQLSQGMLGLLRRAAQSGPDVLLFAVTAGLGTFFLSAGFPKSMAFLEAQLPDRLRQRLRGVGTDLKSSFGGLLRTQLLLMGLCFLELLLAFRLLRVGNTAELALLTALVDALPVFGTGTVLLPWAAGSALLGDGGRALGLVLVWIGSNVLRNCLQAKLLGDQIGLSPMASLMAVYVGWQIGGVGGMLLLPVLLSVLQQLNDRGAIRLWRKA